MEKSASGPWIFRTAEEAEYATPFCKKVAFGVAQAAVRLGHPQFQVTAQKSIDEAPDTKRKGLAQQYNHEELVRLK